MKFKMVRRRKEGAGDIERAEVEDADLIYAYFTHYHTTVNLEDAYRLFDGRGEGEGHIGVIFSLFQFFYR